MKKLMRVVRISVLGMTALVVIALAVIYGLTERQLRETHEIPLVDIEVPGDSVSIAEGGRLARVRGCYDGCHGPGLDGQVFIDEPGMATIHAPNLTQVAAQYSDAELERVIRRGVRRDGRAVVIMPSNMFAELSDGDLGKIISFIRAQPPTTGESTIVRLGPSLASECYSGNSSLPGLS